ncbi:MAG TPA: hypothetical protein DD730_06145 [Desulfosporosinus sp.]|jgi:drug/metabolite transporter (DMT)-like permease|nr:hypothetical protein [Desulfosporosinus sp.]
MQWLIMTVYLLLSASGLILFKLGSEIGVAMSITSRVFSLKIGWISLLGIVCYGCSFLIYLGLVSKLNLSYLVPVTTGIMYVLILVASAVIFKESITLNNILGCILVLAGVVLINVN